MYLIASIVIDQTSAKRNMDAVTLDASVDGESAKAMMDVTTATSLLEQLATRLGRSLQAPQEHGILPTTQQQLDTTLEKINAIEITVQEIRKLVNASSSNSVVVPPSE